MKNFDTWPEDKFLSHENWCKNPRCFLSGGGIGSAESQTTTTTSNNQSIIGNAAPQSTQISVGGGNTGNEITQIKVSSDPLVISRALDTVDRAISSNSAVVSDAFTFGAETETIAAQEVGAGQATINALAGQITGNASTIDPATGLPQTNAPDSGWNKLISYGSAVVIGISILVFIRKGKA